MYLYIVLIRIFFSIKSEITIIIKFNKFKKGSGFFFFWLSKIQNYFMVFNRQCTECIHKKSQFTYSYFKGYFLVLIYNAYYQQFSYRLN